VNSYYYYCSLGSLRTLGRTTALALMLAGCANVSQPLMSAGACPRAAIEICKQSGPRQDCRCIRRSAFSRDTIIRIP